MKHSKQQKIYDFDSFIGDVKPGSSEWEYMWDELAKKPVNSMCDDPSVCLNETEVWQYMGTYFFEEEGAVLHSFRHRYHPAIESRFCLNVRPSEIYLAEIEL